MDLDFCSYLCILLPSFFVPYHLITKRMISNAHQEHGQAVSRDQRGEAMYRAKGTMNKPWGGLWKALLATHIVPFSPSSWLRAS